MHLLAEEGEATLNGSSPKPQHNMKVSHSCLSLLILSLTAPMVIFLNVPPENFGFITCGWAILLDSLQVRHVTHGAEHEPFNFPVV